MSIVACAIASERSMNPPSVYKLTIPKNQRTNKIAKIVKNIVFFLSRKALAAVESSLKIQFS